MTTPRLSERLRSATLRQFLTFAAIGGLATATHALVALGAHEGLGLAPLSANLAGYCCAVLISYLGNARLTFRKAAMHGPQFARFLTISLVALGLNQLLVLVLTGPLQLPFAVALIPVIILVPIFSFTASKIWAFRTAR